MKYSYNDIMEPWYPEEFKIIDLDNVKRNMYAVSNYGRILNVNTGRYLSPLNHAGYLEIKLYCEDGSRKGYRIHVLVAIYFIPKTQDDINNDRIYVNHKNLIRSMNYVHNLEWVNMTENNNHSIQYRNKKLNNQVVKRLTYGWGDGRNCRGERSGLSRLTEKQVIDICKLLEQKYSAPEICRAIGLENNKNNTELVYNIKRRIRWKHISKDYNF